MLSDAPGQRLLRLAIAIAATVWLLIAGTSGDIDRFAHSAPDLAHTALTSLTGGSAVNADHTHVEHGSSLTCLELLASAVLPPLASTLVALGLLAAVATLAGLLVDRVVRSGRSPPRAVAAVITGRDVLTRFCVARR